MSVRGVSSVLRSYAWPVFDQNFVVWRIVVSAEMEVQYKQTSRFGEQCLLDANLSPFMNNQRFFQFSYRSERRRLDLFFVFFQKYLTNTNYCCRVLAKLNFSILSHNTRKTNTYAQARTEPLRYCSTAQYRARLNFVIKYLSFFRTCLWVPQRKPRFDND